MTNNPKTKDKGLIMETPKGTMVALRWRTKQGIKCAYKWDGFMDLKEGESPKDWSIEDLTPLFMFKGHLIMENWTLNSIRKKFFIDLKDAKDWERDKWMPKVLHLLSFVMKKEMVSLKEVALWLGMPHCYLSNLCRRDPNFRRLVIHWRLQNLDIKSDRVRGEILTGKGSLLPRILPHHSANWFTPNGDRPITNPVDVGWKPKLYGRKR